MQGSRVGMNLWKSKGGLYLWPFKGGKVPMTFKHFQLWLPKERSQSLSKEISPMKYITTEDILHLSVSPIFLLLTKAIKGSGVRRSWRLCKLVSTSMNLSYLLQVTRFSRRNLIFYIFCYLGPMNIHMHYLLHEAAWFGLLHRNALTCKLHVSCKPFYFNYEHAATLEDHCKPCITFGRPIFARCSRRRLTAT